MSRTRKIVEILIICLVIIAFFFGIIIYNLKAKDMATEPNSNSNGEGDTMAEYQTEKVRDATKFFSIQNCIQDKINKNFIAKDMNVLDGENIMSFAVYGKILEADNNEKDAYYIFRIDFENNTFNIDELDTSKYKNINEINLETDLKSIENTGNNTMKYTAIKDEEISRMYYEQFLKLEIEKPEEAYDLLDENYKKERFSSLEEYKEYINANKDKIETGAMSKYSRDIQEDCTEYLIVDNYNNYYTIKETSIMNYKIMLDNYTIKVDDYVEKYEKLENENKIQANVYIFLQMINTNDYKHAYELLDENFRKNNFDTVEKFQKYVEENFFEYNINSSVSTEKSIESQGEYYVYKTVIRNDSGSAAESKQLTIIMKLLEGTNFTMSFSL